MSEPLANLDPSKLLFFSENDPHGIGASSSVDDPATVPRTFKRTNRAMVGKGGIMTTGITSSNMMPTDWDV